MLISKNLQKKKSEVSVKTRSTPASISFIGQVTKHTTVKWTIHPSMAAWLIQKFGFINGVDNVNWPPYRALRSDEGLTLETSAFRISVRWPIYIVNCVDKTKFLYTTSPPTQHHSFFRNYPLHSFSLADSRFTEDRIREAYLACKKCVFSV